MQRLRLSSNRRSPYQVRIVTFFWRLHLPSTSTASDHANQLCAPRHRCELHRQAIIKALPMPSAYAVCFVKREHQLIPTGVFYTSAP
eukprot:1473131-Pleurochrysis_carterae.AAC.1